MLQHFVRVAALERAVIDDDMEEVRKHAKAIKQGRTGDPASWAPYVSYLHRAADAVLRAPDMDQAAIATATVVGQCGRCHKALGVGLKGNKGGDAPADATVAQKMRRHQWATDVLRTGIVFSSDELWVRGAKVLASSPLHTSEVSGAGPIEPKVAEHVTILRKLAEIAVTAKPEERQGTYGAILRTCTNCHQKAR
jgi:cytochrome c553